MLLSLSHPRRTSSKSETNLCLNEIQEEMEGNEHFPNTFAPDSTSDTLHVFHLKVTQTLQRLYKYFCNIDEKTEAWSLVSQIARETRVSCTGTNVTYAPPHKTVTLKSAEFLSLTIG